MTTKPQRQINACRKGKIKERQAAKFLRSLGFDDAARGQQHKGGEDSPDVVCPSLPNIHFEVKADKSIGIGTKALCAAYMQSVRDSGSIARRPVVLWYEFRRGWRLSWVVHGTIVTAIPNQGLIQDLNSQ